jgi:hypothetical protein
LKHNRLETASTLEVVEPFSLTLRLIDMGIEPRVFSDYRSAFAEFAQKVRQARALVAATNPDWQAIDAALFELEKARVNYDHRRDILTQELLRTAPRRPVPAPASDSIQTRVKEVAELRWELAGKPEGTDEENWYRAEEIVRCAAA